MFSFTKTKFLLLFNFLFLALAANSFSQNLVVTSQSKVIPNEGIWYIPINSASSKVALFSEQREPFSIINKSTSSQTIAKIYLILAEGTIEEEYTLQNTELRPGPLEVKNLTLAPQQTFDFYVRFYPVQSKQTSAKVIIEYGAGQKYTFTVKGTGRDKASLQSKFTVKATQLLGSPTSDEMVTGMVADPQGNIYFAGQVIGLKDRFAYDLFYGKISAAGELVWAKLWAGPFRDASRDPGQNDESGGCANALALDEEGYLYLTGSTSPANTNNNFSALILKINPVDGEIVWEKLWRPEWPSSLLAKHNAEAYGLDVRGGIVFVTGTSGAALDNAEAFVFLLGLKAQDGSLLFQDYFDPTPKTNDRGYCVKADGKGNLYLGGLAAGKISLLVKFKLDGAKPILLWAKSLETGWGSFINSLDIDAEGNVYASIERRGTQAYFSFLKLDPEGSLVWGKTYEGGNNKNNNCMLVKVVGQSLYAAGRIGLAMYDAQFGDAFLIRVRLLDGSEELSSFYYSGKGPDELAEHRIKGLALVGKRLFLLGQVYTGNYNGTRYWGYWYQGESNLSDYRPSVTDLGLKENDLIAIKRGQVKDATSSREILDLKQLMIFQAAKQKKDGVPPDSDLIFWQIELNEN